jgi:hypothetical protein
MDSTAQLQRIIGKTSKFRRVQTEAVDAILAGERLIVVVVMLAGAGKSMLFFLFSLFVILLSIFNYFKPRRQASYGKYEFGIIQNWKKITHT